MNVTDELALGLAVPVEQQLILQRIQAKRLTCVGIQDNGAVVVRTSEGDVVVHPSPVTGYKSIEEYRLHLDQLLDAAMARRLPDDWYRARRGLRIVIESADYDLTNIACKPCGEPGAQSGTKPSEGVVAVLVHTDLLEQRVSWVTKTHLECWGVDLEEAWSWASGTMDELLKRTEIQVMDIDGYKAGMLSTPTAFKAGMLFAPGFKEKLKDTLGWPVIVAVPSWDAVYLLGPESDALLGDLTRVVARDLQAASRPVTGRMMVMDDEGLKFKE